MTEPTNSDLITSLQNVLKLRATDIKKFKSSYTIVPTIETNPHLVSQDAICRGSGTTTSGTTSTILTVDTNRDFYLQTVNLSLSKSAACDTATGLVSIYSTFNGATRNLIVIAKTTLTAQDSVCSITFPKALKVDRGAGIIISLGTFTAGTQAIYGSVTGYYA